MKIVLATGIYPPEIGGPATYTRALALALQKRGHAVTVIAYGESVDGESSAFSVIRVSRRGGFVVRYVRYAWNVWKYVRCADVVYVQGPVSEGLPATIAARFARCPMVMKVVGDYAWEMAQHQGEQELPDAFVSHRHRGLIRAYEWIERFTARNAQRVIVPSKYLQSIVERWGVASEKIQVIVNASETLPSVDTRESIRQKYRVGDSVVVLSAVRAVPWKSLDRVIRWWREMPESHLFVIAGDGPELEVWKELAKKFQVESRVRFLGSVNRHLLAEWYAVADVFLLPSKYEGYPNVIAEATSVGLPCLVSDQGGNPETREQEPDLVRVIPIDDEVAWVSALQTVTRRAVDQSSTHTEQRWTSTQMVNATERVLQKVVRSRGSSV